MSQTHIPQGFGGNIFCKNFSKKRGLPLCFRELVSDQTNHPKAKGSALEMMLSLTNDVLQDTVLTRQQKRDLERKQKKEESRLKKALEKFSLPVSFDNETVTAYGPFGYFEAFKKSVGLTQLINRTNSFSNSDTYTFILIPGCQRNNIVPLIIQGSPTFQINKAINWSDKQ